MKKLFFLISFITFLACQKDEIIAPSVYDCILAFSEDSANHSKNDRFEAAMKKVKELVPGVQIGVRSKDGNVWLGSQGLADIPNEVPFENCTKTMVGSVSKMYTAIAILQLHQENILSIDDLAKDWLNAEMVSQIANAEQATIKQLLNHTSGIKDYLSTEHHVNSVNIPFHQISPEEKLEIIYGKSAAFPRGEKYEYSNSNYVLLGLIAAKARNLGFDTVIERYISEPLGLQNTVQGTTEQPIPVDAARGYLAVNGGKYIDVRQFSVADAATGDGGIATNMQEALTFIEAIFNQSLIAQSTFELIQKNAIRNPNQSLFGKDNSYGLGFQITTDHPKGLVIGHSGSTSAYWSYVIHFPDSKVSIAIAYNGDTDDDKAFIPLLKLIEELVEVAFE